LLSLHVKSRFKPYKKLLLYIKDNNLFPTSALNSGLSLYPLSPKPRETIGPS